MDENRDKLNQGGSSMDIDKILLDEIRLCRSEVKETELRLNKKIEGIELRVTEKVQCIDKQLVKLKVTSGLWGGISGIATGLATIFLHYFGSSK